MQNQERSPDYELAPDWVGEYPTNNRHPEMVLIDLGDGSEKEWRAATIDEAQALADPRSSLGDLLQPYARIGRLTYMTYN
ncbi:MAG: hypothetical protein QOH93_3164 [Chloroflexia bacterium]|nr:hypothetical protein [Chloroflexia bacterium]